MTLSNPTSPIEQLLQHRDFVRALALKLTRDHSAAEDLEQETWLAAIEKPPRRCTSPRGWLTRVLRNLAFERHRKDRRRKWREHDRETPHEAPSPVEIQEHQRLRERLADSLQALPEEDRTAIELRCAEGLPPREISAHTGIPLRTVYSRLKRGLSSMRRDLDREYGDRRNWSVALISLAELPDRAEAAPLALAGPASLALLWKLALAAGVLALAGLWIGMDSWDSPDTQRLANGPEPLAAEPITTNTNGRGSEPIPATLERSPIGEATAPATTGPAGQGSLLTEVFWDDPRERAPGVPLLLEALGDEQTGGRVIPTELDGRAWIGNLAAGEWQVSASHGRARRVQVLDSEPARLELVLSRGPDLDLRVRTPEERNHGGAEVFLSWPDRPETSYFAGRTDAEGRLQLSNISPDAWIWARAEGYGPSDRLSTATPLSVTDGVQKMLLDLTEKGPSIAIRVVDSAGRPVAGAKVRVAKDFEPYFGPRGGLRLPPFGTEGATETDGTIALESLRGQELVVQAEAPGYSPARESLPGGADSATVCLRRPASVKGTILGEDGEALSEVRVQVRTESGAEVLAEAYTAVDGSYLLEQIPPGAVTMEALCRAREQYRSGSGALVLEEGRAGEWSARLEPAKGIGGRALDAHGRPLAGWVVTLERSEQALACPELNLISPRPGAITTRTEQNGRYFFPRAERGAHWIYLGDPEDEDSVLAWRENVQLGAHDVELQATSDRRPTARIVGRVRRPDGVIPGGTEVHVYGPLLRTAKRSPIDFTTGEFEIGPLNPSRYRLLLWAPGYPAQDVPEHAVVELAPGELLDLEEIVRPWRAEPPGR